MPVQKINIEKFLEMAALLPVIDVRSPGEYAQAHIPDAFNLPLFADEERKIVGTAYKQQSREAAIKIGLDFFGVKMRAMVEQVERLIVDRGSLAEKHVLIHCWRGGMRSAAVAWLLDLYGYKIYTLAGGYKKYRQWVLAQFEKGYSFNIIGGYTGSGKTLLIRQLINEQKNVIDLEAIANHKGSAFGAVGQQPRQEMFENILALELAAKADDTIWLEDESQRIGNLQVPMPLWFTMRRSPVFFIDIPFEERLTFITEEYSKMEKEKLVAAIMRIQKRLGGLDTKNAISYLLEDNYSNCFAILLKYYDKWYSKALDNRENLPAVLNKIQCSGVDTTNNIQKLLSCAIVQA